MRDSQIFVLVFSKVFFVKDLNLKRISLLFIEMGSWHNHSHHQSLIYVDRFILCEQSYCTKITYVNRICLIFLEVKYFSWSLIKTNLNFFCAAGWRLRYYGRVSITMSPALMNLFQRHAHCDWEHQKSQAKLHWAKI